MDGSRANIRIASLALKRLIVEAQSSPAVRQSRVQRVWPCGCVADYDFDKSDAAR
jgi:hypothetical protein